MTCSVSIKYPDQMNFIDFHKVSVGMAYRGAKMLVRNIVDEKEPYDEDCADPELYYKFDNDIVIRNDIYEKVALAPLVKKVIVTALVDNLKDIFEKSILDYVCPFSQAEKDQGVWGSDVANTPVNLRATNEDEWLTFVFSADLDWKDADRSIWEIWQNVKVDIKYMQLDGDGNRQ